MTTRRLIEVTAECGRCGGKMRLSEGGAWKHEQEGCYWVGVVPGSIKAHG